MYSAGATLSATVEHVAGEDVEQWSGSAGGCLRHSPL